MDTLDAFTAEALAIQRTSETITAEQWDNPGVGVWTIAELLIHTSRGAHEVLQYLDQPLESDTPAVDRFDFFAFDMAANADSVAQGSQKAAATVDSTTLPALFAAHWTDVDEAVRDRPPGELLATWRGPMRLDEYLATRVVELTVHHLDLTTALGVRAAVTDQGLAITEEILASMLDGDRPEGMDAATFVLVASGRDLHPDPRFPLLQ